MRTVESHGSFAEAIAASTPQAQQVARALRAVIAELYPEVTEVPWPKQRVVGYGLGPKKMTEHFAYIGAHTHHVNLGFNYGSTLPDPEEMLEGRGKKFRHLKVHTLDDAAGAGLKALIEAAIREREHALDRTR